MLFPVFVVIETCRVIKSALADFETKTTRNTAEKVASMGIGYVGGYGGGLNTLFA